MANSNSNIVSNVWKYGMMWINDQTIANKQVVFTMCISEYEVCYVGTRVFHKSPIEFWQ